jgi:hypothetical protein
VRHYDTSYCITLAVRFIPGVNPPHALVLVLSSYNTQAGPVRVIFAVLASASELAGTYSLARSKQHPGAMLGC